MANVKVTLKDGSVKEVAAGTTLLEVAKGLSQKLGKQALLAVVDGVNKDLTDKLEHDSSVEFVVPESSEGLHAIRHTAAHIMAQAIQHLFPDTKFAIGPAIANGFYYDLDSEHVFVPEDLIAIEKEMAKSSLRVTIGKYNTKEEVDYLIENLEEIIARLRMINV